MKSVAEMLADVEVRFVAIVREQQERDALAAMTIPERRQRLSDLWQAESPQCPAYCGPTCEGSLELAQIEAELVRELVELDDPPYVSPEAEAAWDGSYSSGKTPERLPR